MSELDDLEETLGIDGWVLTGKKPYKHRGAKKKYPNKAAKKAAARARYVARCASDPAFLARERETRLNWHRKQAKAKREIVSAEMLLAGITELCNFNRDFEQEEDAVRRIYLAMRDADLARMRVRRASTVASKPPSSKITE